MNFFKTLIILINEQGQKPHDINQECLNDTSKFTSAIGTVDEDSFNAVFVSALTTFSKESLAEINEEKVTEFLEILKQEIKDKVLSFQFKDLIEKDYVFNDEGNIVLIEVSRHKVLTDMLLNSLDMADYSNGAYYFEKLLYKIKREAKKEVKYATI